MLAKRPYTDRTSPINFRSFVQNQTHALKAFSAHCAIKAHHFFIFSHLEVLKLCRLIEADMMHNIIVDLNVNWFFSVLTIKCQSPVWDKEMMFAKERWLLPITESDLHSSHVLPQSPSLHVEWLESERLSYVKGTQVLNLIWPLEGYFVSVKSSLH